MNRKSANIKRTRECLSQDNKQIWHDPYRPLDVEEDNLSSEDDASSEEESNDAAQNLG